MTRMKQVFAVIDAAIDDLSDRNDAAGMDELADALLCTAASVYRGDGPDRGKYSVACLAAWQRADGIAREEERAAREVVS